MSTFCSSSSADLDANENALSQLVDDVACLLAELDELTIFVIFR